jgi:hypothetical protein
MHFNVLQTQQHPQISHGYQEIFQKLPKVEGCFRKPEMARALMQFK